MKKTLLIASLGALLLISGCWSNSVERKKISSVIVGNHTIAVTEALTPEAQARGLGGVTELSLDQGMLFLFPDARERTFWMKDMLIPIDMIWLVDDRIVGIEKNVQPPSSDATDNDLLLYTSPEPVNNVLEVPAAFSDRYKLQIGDRVVYR